MKKLGLFYLAVRNIRRKLFRTVSIMLSVAVVAGTLFSATMVIYSVKRSIAVGTERLGADILVVPADDETKARGVLVSGEPSTFYMDRSVLDKVKAVEGVAQVSPQVFIESSSFSCCYVGNAMLVGFDPQTDFSVKSWLADFSIKEFGPDDIIAGRGIPTMVGRTLKFYGHDFNVVGVLAQTGMTFLDSSAFIRMDAAYRMAEESAKKAVKPITVTPDQISAVLVKVAPDYTPQRVAVKINYAVDGVKSIPSDEVIATVKDQLSKLLTYLLTIGGIVWVMALLLIAVVFSMIVNERQREIGLFRAMGAKKGFMFKLLVTEAALLTTAGGVVGVALGGIMVFSFKNLITTQLKVPYLWPSTAFIVELLAGCILVSLVTGVLAVLYPAALSARMEPYNAIRKGE
ncbi:MAG: FtsX-like permease family protein [Nitrospirae bacterium]|nr:FtsX-like permease family protein [Nitrospirota bacterium]